MTAYTTPSCLCFSCLVIVGTIGLVVAMLHPIQLMKFYQWTTRGDSKTFMGGRGRDNPLQGLCQGNGAAPACWLIICSILMYCSKSKGYGSHIISPISGAVIDFLGEIYVDDTDLIVTHPDLEMQEAVLDGLNSSADAWSFGLNITGGVINTDKSQWILAAYKWINGIWRYHPQPDVNITIPLPDGTRAPISPGHVTTAEKSLGVWSAIDGDDSKRIEENITRKTRNWINHAKHTLTGAHGLDCVQVQTLGRNSLWYRHFSHPTSQGAESPPHREVS